MLGIGPQWTYLVRRRLEDVKELILLILLGFSFRYEMYTWASVIA
jgi:hypothetical protein